MTDAPVAPRILRAVLLKELRGITRDGRFRTAAVVVLALLVAAVTFGLHTARLAEAEREAAQQAAEESWLSQGEKNPHVAAHYGKYVFKPPGVLAFFDPGVDAYLGVTLKLEAHRQHLPHDAAAQDASALQRFGQLSPAAVLQLFVPLMLIALGFGAWTAEREGGTLRLLAATGVPPQRLLTGKALGLAVALGMVLGLPMLAGLGYAVVAGEGLRAGLIATIYGVYFAVYLGVVLFISARVATSQRALIALVAFWGVTCLVAPRVVAEISTLAAPLPSPAAFAQELSHSLTDGLPGTQGREARVEAIAAEMLQREGFEGAETLMDDAMLQGIELAAEAAFEAEVLDHHVGGLLAELAWQERVAQWGAVASPLLALRSLSAALAGTDFAHHHAFQAQAETYRRQLVAMLNAELARRGGDDVWRYRAGRELWARAPVFEHLPPGLGDVLASQRVALGVLFGWLALVAFGAARAARRIRVVL